MDDTVCSAQEAWKRIFAVVTNAFFYWAVIYLRRKRPVSDYLIEILVFSAVTWASSFHHFCEEELARGCIYCILNPTALLVLDFLAAFHVIPTLIMFGPRWVENERLGSNQTGTVKAVLHIIVLVYNYTIFAFYSEHMNFWYVAGQLILFFTVIPYRIAHARLRGEDVVEVLLYKIDWKDLVMASVHAIAAVTFKVLGDSMLTQKWLFHSLWHLFSAFAIIHAIHAGELCRSAYDDIFRTGKLSHIHDHP